MTFIDSPPVNIRKYVYMIHPDTSAEFLHTFLSIEGARDYCRDHNRMMGSTGVYEIREVERVIETLYF